MTGGPPDLSVVESGPAGLGGLTGRLQDQLSAWPPGRTFLARSRQGLVGAARLADPSPGDGYHGEHCQSVHADAEAHAYPSLIRAAVTAAGQRCRLEAECPEVRPALASAFVEAGLVREATLPRGWGEGELWLFGRKSSRRLDHAPPIISAELQRTPDLAPTAGYRLVLHGLETRAALAEFLDGLTPGRAYPPGTFLSEAERVETRRPGDLDAVWILALDAAGSVVGGVVLAPDGRPERAQVRRVHVDVKRGHRGRGLATALLRKARVVAGELGVARVEADPRSGNPVCRALEAAGLTLVGRQTGAWRMRTPSRSWDEDVLLYSAPALASEDA